MNQKKRPLGVTILAILAGLAAFAAIIHTLQLLGLLSIPGPFGIVRFFSFNLIGAIMWGLVAAIYIWLTTMLWSVDARGWLFLVVLSIFNLIVVILSLLGAATWQSLLPAILINAIILIICLMPNTKDAFDLEQVQSTLPTPTTATAVSKPMPEPEPQSEATAAVENVDIAAETAAAAAAIATTEIAEPAAVVEEAVEETAPDPEPDVLPVLEEASEPVTAVVENVDIEAETAVATAAVAKEITPEEAEERLPQTPAESIETAAHSSPGEEAKFVSQADFIEGIGPAYSAKLQEVGIDSPQSLLEAGATPKGRQELEEKTGISHKLIMKWLNAADLYRIKGIGSQYGELLVTAGVNTVLELAQRNPENLHKKLIEINEEKHRVREVPSLNMVTSWVDQAKELPRVIHY